MGTTNEFDLTGFSQAIRSADWQYQLAQYADNAEVEIVAAAQPAAPLGTLRGKPAIEQWLDAMSARAVGFDVRDAWSSPDKVEYTEECRYRDGSKLLFACTARVRGGQISQAAMTVVQFPPQAGN